MDNTSNLLAHCGARKLTREELKTIATPEGTATHRPVPHIEIVEALAETLSFRNIGVVRDEYAVSNHGMKLFGVLDLETSFDGCRFSIGLRNANDKSMRLALTVGYHVFSATTWPSTETSRLKQRCINKASDSANQSSTVLRAKSRFPITDSMFRWQAF
jgi:hypothetical protein